MAGACPNNNWWNFISIFLKLDRDITKTRKTFLVGWDVSWIGGGSTHLMVVAEPVPIISEVRGKFVLLIEASKHIGGGGGGTQLQCFYCLVPYTDLGGRGVFRRLTSPL